MYKTCNCFSAVCNTPASPSNGDIWVSSDGMTVTYSCDLGYTLQGETSNTCNTDGSGWLHGQPSCSKCFLAELLTRSLLHHFETVQNSKKLQTTTEMWLLKDFKIQIA